MPFEFIRQEIEDVVLIKPKVFGDNRGFFLESYKKSDFIQNGIDVEFNQDNHSKSTAICFKRASLSRSAIWQCKTCPLFKRKDL